jgi:hypothetical protein
MPCPLAALSLDKKISLADLMSFQTEPSQNQAYVCSQHTKETAA